MCGTRAIWNRTGLCGQKNAPVATAGNMLRTSGLQPWKKGKKERKRLLLYHILNGLKGALYCVSKTTTREPLDQQNWKTVFMRSNGSLSWNTVSVCIYPLWDNISSYCWLFHVYTLHSFMMQIQFALQKQVPPGIQTTGCGSAEMVVAFYVSSGCRLSSSS